MEKHTPEIKTFKISSLPDITVAGTLDDADMLIVADVSEHMANTTKSLKVGDFTNYAASKPSLQDAIAKAIAKKISGGTDELADAVDNRVTYVIEHAVLSAGNATTF